LACFAGTALVPIDSFYIMRIALSDAAGDSKARASTNLKAMTEFDRLDGFRIAPQTVMREASNDFLKTREVPRWSSSRNRKSGRRRKSDSISMGRNGDLAHA